MYWDASYQYQFSYAWYKYYGPTSPKSTYYSHLKLEVLQSDKNQTMVNEASWRNNGKYCNSHIPTHGVNTSCILSFHQQTNRLIPTLSQPYFSLFNVWMGNSNPSDFPNYDVTCSACGVMDHNLIFCRKVMRLKKSTSTPYCGKNTRRKRHK